MKKADELMNCRFCSSKLLSSFADLGVSPISNAYVQPEKLEDGEMFFPLHAFVCSECFLVQVDVFEAPENIFKDYAYFSSYSQSWLNHCKSYAEKAIEELELNEQSKVIEIASNDGYLLQYFVIKGIPVLGIEPAINVAEIAKKNGIDTISEFFDVNVANGLLEKNVQADLLIANNVLAHVPDLNGFVKGIELLLKPSGIFTAEFPHLLELVENNQFDTIYHEHFSYFSFTTIQQIFSDHGLKIVRVERLTTHGGSLRIYAVKKDNIREIEKSVQEMVALEVKEGMNTIDYYTDFNQKITALKRNILTCLIDIKNKHKKIVAYGAPAKGNTLLNFCGIGKDFINFTVDKNPHKKGLYLPGTRIPICDESKIKETKPDYVLILPWNLKEEIANQISYIRNWGGQMITFIPDVNIW